MTPVYRLPWEDKNGKTVEGGSRDVFPACAIRKGGMSDPGVYKSIPVLSIFHRFVR
jgi:hypothetical protein